MKKEVDVSLLATNYNNEKFLKEFFESIINSTVEPKEIIIVDDGSTDNSTEIIKQFEKKANIKLFAFDENKGRAAALNYGKKKCECKYTLIIDPDDILLPNRIEKQYSFLENKPEIDILGANVIYFNSETGKKLNNSNFPTTHKDIYKTFYKGENGVLQPTILAKTEVLQKPDYIQIAPGQDYVFFAGLAKKGCRFAALKEPVNLMRIHPSSVVSNINIGSIKKIFSHRDKIFNTKTSSVRIYFYYKYLFFYRKSMLNKQKILKYLYLFLSIIFNPIKLINRLRK
ncbi:MAG: glycosyltransferase [Bacteroidales bacterium]|nr:glycosyltransferase [Bacteroidales bacterium]